MDLFFPYDANTTLVGYANVGHLSNMDHARSQMDYIFMVR